MFMNGFQKILMKFNIYKIMENKREKPIKSEKGNFNWKEDSRSKPSQNRWEKEHWTSLRTPSGGM